MFYTDRAVTDRARVGDQVDKYVGRSRGMQQVGRSCAVNSRHKPIRENSRNQLEFNIILLGRDIEHYHSNETWVEGRNQGTRGCFGGGNEKLRPRTHGFACLC